MNQHELVLRAGLLGGERYYVNDVLVHKTWSYALKSERRLLVHGHEIRIVGSAGLRSFSTKAYVDGRLHVEEMFPAYATFVTNLSSGPALAIRIAIIIGISAVTYLHWSGRSQ